ncbi:MAG: type III secretion inner membrane ring lipoprotein SctJ [Parachlamydiales bacterium]|jgi:type III secretion protein J
MKRFSRFFSVLVFLFLTSCHENQSIVNNVDEREANEIIVFLATEGIEAQKLKGAVQETGGSSSSAIWSIQVAPEKSIDAMALLNQQGYPRKKTTTLLELFAKQGLMSTDKEETIRYQSGLEEELTGVIRKIEGVLDASVHISFPQTELIPGAAPAKIKAAVYVKHQGVFDDPNYHLDSKIKRLIASSVEGLCLEDVSIIADKSQIALAKIKPASDLIAAKARGKEYVSIWSVIMTKSSSARFRTIFFTLIALALFFGALAGFLIYKFYPLWQKNKKE